VVAPAQAVDCGRAVDSGEVAGSEPGIEYSVAVSVLALARLWDGVAPKASANPGYSSPVHELRR
jgi:hypothetical protein